MQVSQVVTCLLSEQTNLLDITGNNLIFALGSFLLLLLLPVLVSQLVFYCSDKNTITKSSLKNAFYLRVPEGYSAFWRRMVLAETGRQLVLLAHKNQGQAVHSQSQPPVTYFPHQGTTSERLHGCATNWNTNVQIHD